MENILSWLLDINLPFPFFWDSKAEVTQKNSL